MKHAKTLVLIGITLGLSLLTTAIVFANQVLPRITTACEDKSGLLFAVDDGFSLRKKCQGNSRRVVIIGEQGPQGEPGVNLSKDSFYTEISGPYSTGPGTAQTVIYGCDNADVAISGGLYSSSGPIWNWRTIRNSPNDLQANQHNWVTTITNVAESGTFTLIVKCLKIP